MFYIACGNAKCAEHGAPKVCDDEFRSLFDDGVVQCGSCQHPVLEETAPPGPVDG